jgi:hypothetical protein
VGICKRGGGGGEEDVWGECLKKKQAEAVKRRRSQEGQGGEI